MEVSINFLGDYKKRFNTKRSEHNEILIELRFASDRGSGKILFTKQSCKELIQRLTEELNKEVDS